MLVELRVIILAETPAALCRLCGVTMLERLLRNLQRLGVREAIILPGPGIDPGHLAPDWTRPDLKVQAQPRRATGPMTIDELMRLVPEGRALLLRADVYCDPRLLQALLEATETTLLVDSAPPEHWLSLLKVADKQAELFLCGPALVTRRWLTQKDHTAFLPETLRHDLAGGEVAILDAAAQPAYVVSMRREIRPFWFPAPSLQHAGLAEGLLLDAAQNGTLDAPAILHGPIETALVSRLSWTPITPNQVTFVTMLLGLVVTALFVTGQLWPGAILALVIGILDGVDGKLARVKVETTALGQWEHEVDYAIETSWWAALALHFSGQLPWAFAFFALLFLSDLVDRLAKRHVKKKLGRNLDDVTRFDRLVRFIGARRNISVWILTGGLLLGAAPASYALVCLWTTATATVHLFRAFQIRRPAGPA